MPQSNFVILTHSNGDKFFLNLDQVSLITLVNGETKIRVVGKEGYYSCQEAPEEILPLMVKQHMQLAKAAMGPDPFQEIFKR